ncbi:MAG TPA: class I SAM-dependent methyltransferase [Aggregatilinea sp.]|uniref:class I SAM-dependent methyltransferase n=1 Tax=Aggregatilinea sp. TaxID=2806333 RepID=UPI002C3DD846|nr:class I SAM-dependent methyltransferase [Aggregatilinea sp.]HML23945.1 class I SAM-dependent methyltransferase [Aggregatilinea sp.]
MTVERLWQIYREQGYAGAQAAEVHTAMGHFYLALLAWGEEDIEQALLSAHVANALDPENPVFREAVTYLERVNAQGKARVYVDGEAFAAFIRGGGNIGLYAAVSDALRMIYQEYETLSLLDIGVGDGLALLPALTKNVARLTLVEPSEAMLAQTTAALDAWQMSYRAYAFPVQSFMRTTGSEHWDVIEATWSLQSVAPEQRPSIFAWMRAHGDRTLIAEFDVPAFEALFAPDRVATVLARYVDGLAEYPNDGGLVAQGFLMPVMFGYFDRSAARTNYEGPIETWVDGLHAAGFGTVETRRLFPYWWADAVLIDAR